MKPTLSRTTRKDPTQSKTLRESYRRDLVRLFASYRRDALVALKQSTDPTARMLAAADIDIIGLDETLRGLGAALVTKGVPITRDHVIANYTAGTGFGTKQLNRIGVEAVIGEGPADWRVIDSLKVRNLTALRGVSDEMNKQIIRELSDGIQKGESMPKLAKRISGRVDSIGKTRATTMARTETMTAFNQGAELRYAQAGVETLEWLSAHDPPRVCEECLALDGTTFRVKSNHPRPPIHPNCFIEGTRLEQTDDIVAAIRAEYSGDVIKITTSNKQHLTVTPNHMLLTPSGFIAAKYLHEGDDVICRSGFERVEHSINPNNNDIKPTVNEVFGAYRSKGGMVSERVPAAAEDLHNDGVFVKGDIDVITPDGFLLGAADTPFFQHVCKYYLSTGYPELVSLPVGSNLTSVLLGLAFAADGGMSGGRKTASFFRGRLTHPEIHGLTTIPRGDSEFIEAASNNLAGAAKVRSELLNRHSGVVQSPEFENVNVDPVSNGFDSEFAESSADGGSSNPEMISKLLSIHSGIIEVQKVVSVDVDSSYHGYIYDFQTLSTLCIGNGVITSNCRCTTIPVLGKPKPVSK